VAVVVVVAGDLIRPQGMAPLSVALICLRADQNTGQKVFFLSTGAAGGGSMGALFSSMGAVGGAVGGAASLFILSLAEDFFR
jgi:hypothetical protein